VKDPESVAACVAAGVGSTVRLRLGGKTDRRHGEPITIDGYVRLISDGRFVNRGPMHAGVEVDLGRAAVVVCGGVEVLVTEFAETPIDLNVFRAHGIEPTAKRVIALKGKGHFRASFEPIAKRVILVEGPGITGSDLSRLTFRHVRRPIWPLDEIDRWSSGPH
jgi:microcystin degradation protein MlrC